MWLSTYNVIPKGPYCYSGSRGRGKCPFWSISSEYPNQYNGYCAFLGKGDWNLGMDDPIFGHKPSTGERWMTPKSDVPIPINLLWDQCKECGINDDWEGDLDG